MTKVSCIYHANCLDGFAAAYAVWKKFPDARFTEANYGEPIPPERVLEGRDVYIVDFSYKQAEMRKIASVAASVTVYDHHKTAEEELQPLLEEGVVNGCFSKELSGCGLTWLNLHGAAQMPLWMPFIQDRDLWRFQLSGTREICLALSSYPKSMHLWDGFNESDSMQELFMEGAAISRYIDQKVNEVIKTCYDEKTIHGMVVPFCNAPHFLASEVGHVLCQDVPFAATWYWNGDGNMVVSLRSNEIGEDVGAIAKAYGGGGHKHAAGFVTEIGKFRGAE